MTDEMKPVRCGCGGEAKVVQALCNDKKGKPFVMGYSVNCEICGTRTRPMSAGAMAVAVWNRAMSGNGQERAKDARCNERTAKVETVEKPNVYKCSECGQYFHSTAWGSPVEYCSRCGAKLDWSGNE